MMCRVHTFMQRFARDESGATAIEYGLIVALIAIGFLVGLRAVGDANTQTWNNASGTLVNAMQGN